MAVVISLRKGLPSAGLIAGPSAWAISFQASYVIVPWQCANMIRIVPWLSALGILVALAGCLLSYRAWAAASHGWDTPAAGRRCAFVAALGIATAALFALVLAMQGMASFMFEGCER
ncbi:hypothetical protein LB518_11830 [Mesorhizobium sp. BR1-1-16]|uniref:hypothetical protein n=1 Tax=Mesorhizobium sp. BR1-1-16 TaxID=2876653 RepID=UPI001CCEC1D4|nr:hypothetical protein [Mesorhizobium sp. BR1-1-16]MBZ9936987.1 hypothetical protein [Mesorhizobium sp. BR1-1-16]